MMKHPSFCKTFLMIIAVAFSVAAWSQDFEVVSSDSIVLDQSCKKWESKTIENLKKESVNLVILNHNREVIKELELQGESRVRIPIKDLPRSVYILEVRKEGVVLLRQKIIHN